jgi:hypothetical protein
LCIEEGLLRIGSVVSDNHPIIVGGETVWFFVIKECHIQLFVIIVLLIVLSTLIDAIELQHSFGFGFEEIMGVVAIVPFEGGVELEWVRSF